MAKEAKFPVGNTPEPKNNNQKPKAPSLKETPITQAEDGMKGNREPRPTKSQKEMNKSQDPMKKKKC